MIFARKINKIPKFYMILARKMPKFYIIIARKIFFPELWHPQSPTPMIVTTLLIKYHDSILPLTAV